MANIIYYDLLNTKYSFKFYNYIFYFSSPVYLKKFRERIISYINNEKKKFQIKYFVDISDEFFAIMLYKKIETRGFYIKIDDTYFNSIDSLNLELKAKGVVIDEKTDR